MIKMQKYLCINIVQTQEQIFLLENVTFKPHETKIINLSRGNIDEIHAIVTNLSDIPIMFNKNDKLDYVEMYSCDYPKFVENVREKGLTGKTYKYKIIEM